MRHTATLLTTSKRHRRGLCEIGGVGGSLACLRLQTYPGEGGPGESHVAEGIAVAEVGFLIGVAGIDLHSLVCQISEHALDGFLIVCYLHLAREEDTLVGVGHSDHGYIVVVAALVVAVEVIGDDIAIYAGPEAAEAHVVAAEFFRAHLAQLLQRFLLQVFLEGQSLLLSTFL